MSAERRLAALEAALRDLPRVPAPRELDGLVVAAMHAGQRQERALEALAALGSPRVPGDLEQRVAEELQALEPAGSDASAESGGPLDAGSRVRAPRELELALSGSSPEDVERRLADRFARHIGRLERLAAPAELDARVAADLGRSSSRAARRTLGPILAGAGTLAGALALVLLLRGAPPASEPAYVPRFEVVRGDEASPAGATSSAPSLAAANFLNGLTGGAELVARQLADARGL